MRKSQLFKINLGGTRFRGKITLFAEPTEAGTMQDRLEKLDLIKTIADQPELTAVAGHDFEVMKVYRTSDGWQADFEADL